MPYSIVGPPFPLCFRRPSISPAGLDRWRSLSRHFSFLLCSFHLACPAYFQAWFGHLFYQSLLTRVHTCSNHPAPGPNWLSPQRTGHRPCHWTHISFSSLSPLVLSDYVTVSCGHPTAPHLYKEFFFFLCPFDLPNSSVLPLSCWDPDEFTL